MKFLTAFYQWTFKRLPRRFSIPLILFTVLFFLYGFPWLTKAGAMFLAGQIERVISPDSTIYTIAKLPMYGVFTLLCIIVGILVSYWLAVLVYRILRNRKSERLTLHGPTIPTPVATDDKEKGNPLSRYHSIGIILAGGGAKGAYQAGAMKAIYEFLDTHQAQHKVRMIAGTSIGSWNALFWLAGLIKGPVGKDGQPLMGPDNKPVPGLLEQWWKKVDVKSVIRPAAYVPLRQNYLLSNEPWVESFQAIFGDGNEAVKQSLLQHIREPHAPGSMHFYFTRSNVALARLEFTTNRDDLNAVHGNLPGEERPRPPVPLGTYKVATQVEDISEAVFSSMDLPPLFPYMTIGQDSFEDGGVVDNLPIRFGTEIEKCDLLFILPLNANFNEEVNTSSVVQRLFRVLNVRQGVLERNAFKMVYLYNELASLRDRTEKLEGQMAALDPKAAAPTSHDDKHDDDDDHSTPDERALKRKHKMVQVFSICPAPKLLINTADFWRTTEAGRAFQRMYDITRIELEKFDFTSEPGWVRVALVGPLGDVTYLEDF